MNRFDLFALAAAAIVTLFCADITRSAIEIYIVTPELAPAMTALAVLAWIVFTYGPILVAALFWRWSRGRAGWVPHLLFLPVAYGVFFLGATVLGSALNDRNGFDDTIGAPIMTGLLLSIIAVASYGVALISSAVSRVRAA